MSTSVDQTSPSSLLQRTYTGLLDDSVLRYDTDFLGERFFNKMIIKNLFFGGGIYLNDGYLVQHPVARRHLQNERSVLRVMLATNFIRLLTRTGSPEELTRMPETMAQAGNQSFIELTASSEWSDFRPLLDRISQAAFFNGNPKPWPNYDMSVGYKKLTQRIFDHDPSRLGLRHVTWDQLRRIRDAYFKDRPEDGNSRAKYELACRSEFDKSTANATVPLAEMMTIGNQAYHYNFGLALTANEDNGIAVDTTVGAAFDELLNTRAVEQGQIEGIPLISLPKDLPMDEGALFWPFTDPTTQVSQAKRDYLEALDRLLAENVTGIADLKRDVQETTDTYLARIQDIFRSEYGQIQFEVGSSAGLTFATGLLSGPPQADFDPVATAAPTAGLALKMQAAATSETRDVLIERFRIKDATSSFNPSRDDLITLGDIKPQITSLAFDKSKAEAFIKDVPKMFDR